MRREGIGISAGGDALPDQQSGQGQSADPEGGDEERSQGKSITLQMQVDVNSKTFPDLAGSLVFSYAIEWQREIPRKSVAGRPPPMENESIMQKNTPAQKSGEFAIGNDLRVNRLGFGAMRITGKGVWGEPADRAEAIRVLRRAVELGINFIDTADAYGPHVSEEIIAEALHPYPAGLVIATKGGFERPGPDKWVENGRPEHLKAACEGSLRRLRLERIDLYQLHRIDSKVPAEDQIGALMNLQAQGKIKHIGLSEVSVRQIQRAQGMTPIVSVQNRYSVTDRGSEDVVDYCEREEIGFIPWFPLAAGKLSGAAARSNEWRSACELLHPRWLWRGCWRDLQ